MDVDAINALSDIDFINKFGNIVERYQQCAVYLNSRRPYQDLSSIFEAVTDFFNSLLSESIEEILNLHPDLAGKICNETHLTAESVEEQRSAGLRELSHEEADMLNSLNQLYRAKFKFPFVICARENKIQSILNGLKDRLQNERSHELITAIAEVKKITIYRINELLY